MTRKKPIGPVIDQLRKATLGAEMIDLSLAYFLTVGTEAIEDSFQVIMEVTPVGVTRSMPNAMSIILNPTLFVLGTDLCYTIWLWTTVNPVHYSLSVLLSLGPPLSEESGLAEGLDSGTDRDISSINHSI